MWECDVVGAFVLAFPLWIKAIDPRGEKSAPLRAAASARPLGAGWARQATALESLQLFGGLRRWAAAGALSCFWCVSFYLSLSLFFSFTFGVSVFSFDGCPLIVSTHNLLCLTVGVFAVRSVGATGSEAGG